MGTDANLVEITAERHGVAVDLAYAGACNLAGRPIYGSSRCLLRREAEPCLGRAAELAAQCGYRLKIWDAYRPSWAQERLWRCLQDPRYVADLSVGSNHTRGVAVDLTLVDGQGREVDMGTGFDSMEAAAWHFCPGLPDQVQRNRMVLIGIMTQAGFLASDSEWWHYTLPGARGFPLLQDDRIQPPEGPEFHASPAGEEG